MQNSIIIEFDSGKCNHHICSCLDCKGSSDTVPIFYSYKHAIANGWILTKENKYCSPTEEAVFVCPECYKS